MASKKAGTQEVKIRQLLQSMEAEFKSLALASEHLQSIIGNLLGGNAAGATDVDYNLQDLDRVSQTLGELSLFMGQISNEVDPDWEVDAQRAVSSLALIGLASRLLSNDLVRTDNDPYRDAPGDCVLL